MSIVFRCEQCGHRYQVGEERIGQRGKCRECGAEFVVPTPSPPEERSPAGNPILRHAPREKPFELATGDGESIDRLSEHYERYVGHVESVFHELVSDLVHIDVHWIPPDEDRPWHTLATTGMSDRPMTVPEGCEELRFAELLIRLPPDWPLTMDAFRDERHYWPVRLLKQLARLPHEYDTWLSFGHSVPNGDPPEPYAPDTKLCCALLLPVLGMDDDFHSLVLDDDRTVRFWAVVPLHADEMQLKLREGTEALLEKFDQAQCGDVLRIDRPSVVGRKRSWWPFGRK
jgi:hypothetical protein